MELAELYLNRYLYRDSSQEARDASFVSADSSTEDPAAIPVGGAAQDINTSNVFINGDQIEPGTIPQTVLDVSNWGWSQSCTFSSTDSDTVSWSSGVFTSAGGDTYAISAGNTGNMTAKTYIYLDLNVSETAYQTTTTSADSVGIGKVLIGVAENGATDATYNLSEATQIVGDNILANSIDASKIITGQLIVGTNVGLGTAEDSAGVTTIIGNTVTTGYVNALAVTAEYVVANIAIASPTITGGTLQTSTSGQRVVINSDILRSYDTSGVERMRLNGEYFQFYDSGGSNTFRIETPTSLLTVVGALGSNRSVLINGQGGSGYAALGIGGLNYIRADASTGDIEMSTDLDANSYGIRLGGVRRTSWPTSGTTTLSGLTIDTDKNWSGYGITNIDRVVLSGAGDYFDCNSGYIDDARAIYFERGRSTNPSVSGEIRYYDGTSKGFRGYINGFLGQFDLTAV